MENFVKLCKFEDWKLCLMKPKDVILTLWNFKNFKAAKNQNFMALTRNLFVNHNYFSIIQNLPHPLVDNACPTHRT